MQVVHCEVRGTLGHLVEVLECLVRKEPSNLMLVRVATVLAFGSERPSETVDTLSLGHLVQEVDVVSGVEVGHELGLCEETLRRVTVNSCGNHFIDLDPFLLSVVHSLQDSRISVHEAG